MSDLAARLASLALESHPAASVPAAHQKTKTVLFKSKKSQLPVLVVAKDDASVGGSDLGKKLGIKDLRAAGEDAWKDLLGAEKEIASFLALTSSKPVHLVLDASLLSSPTPLAFPNPTDAAGSTILIPSLELKRFVDEAKAEGGKTEEINFSAQSVQKDADLKASAPNVQKSATSSEKERKAAARIEGAVEVAIGIRKELDFPNWYTQVLLKGDMLDYYDVSGCYILKPWSYSVWQAIQTFFDGEIKKLGVENCYFPMFVSSKVLEREKDHIEGFAPEVAWVTRAGQSDLEEPIAIRPTSETVMYPYYAKWIRSYRDLPLRLNQWNSVVRWEFKNPQPFLRTREFLWQEGHTAHIDHEHAAEEVDQILELYRRVYEELLAVPVIPGVKSENEKFAGGFYTKTVEGFVPTTGRGIQGATSHCLGQNFSKMFNITVEDPEAARRAAAAGKPLTEGEGKMFVWQNSWGLSTRSIGVMVMVHGDDQGLVLPPKVASVQVVVVPCGLTVKSTDEQRKEVNDGAEEIVRRLQKVGVRAKADLREGYTPGFKFNDWELRGVPVRLEYGPQDIKKSQVLSVRRANNPEQKKVPIALSELESGIQTLLDDIQRDMFESAKKMYDEHIEVVQEDWERVPKALNEKKVVVIPWCEEPACEDDIKERTTGASLEQADERAPSAGAKSLCIPNDQKRWGTIVRGKTCCVACKKPALRYAMFGRSY